MFEDYPTPFCVAVFILAHPLLFPRPSGGFVLAGFVVPRRGIWVGGVLIKKGTKKCPTACMQADEPNATDCFSRSRWHKVGQVSPLLYKRRQDGGPLHSQIFSVQRSLNLLNTGKLALSFVRKRVKRGADSSDGRNSGPSIVARGRQCVRIVSVVVIAGAQPAPWNRASALKVTVRLFLCKAIPSFLKVN